MTLRKHGVDPAGTQFIEIPFASQPDTLKSKQIDAVATLDPWTTQLRNSGFAKVLAWNYVEIAARAADRCLVRQGRLRAEESRHGRALRRLDPRRHRRHARGPEPRAQHVAAYTGLDPALLKDMPLNNWSYRIDPAKWQAVADMMHTSGELQRPHKVDEYLSDIVKPYLVK